MEGPISKVLKHGNRDRATEFVTVFRFDSLGDARIEATRPHCQSHRPWWFGEIDGEFLAGPVQYSLAAGASVYPRGATLVNQERRTRAAVEPPKPEPIDWGVKVETIASGFRLTIKMNGRLMTSVTGDFAKAAPFETIHEAMEYAVASVRDYERDYAREIATGEVDRTSREPIPLDPRIEAIGSLPDGPNFDALSRAVDESHDALPEIDPKAQADAHHNAVQTEIAAQKRAKMDELADGIAKNTKKRKPTEQERQAIADHYEERRDKSVAAQVFVSEIEQHVRAINLAPSKLRLEHDQTINVAPSWDRGWKSIESTVDAALSMTLRDLIRASI